ncbi:cysteinyl-tRNA synthetase [Thermotomaculum hydrothermale]|uniref:Cysteine--tRNA ligase n=1 Tax=Thermotomaculum hydrothermale TaxID=981385 RepID=A0A7R6PP06_9BACT|nr:cysteine--tRNA ligase [Thermotomaculum hydrothermale]BBB32646.1 cysteinyl-tRNA synthetase [Thermotomaculum hydrothermale]
MKIYNTLSGKLEEFKTLRDKEARIYTCGPTVYDYAHIGNFRTFCFEDIFRRYLKYKGYKVIQVMNLTDVDDKTIRRANEEGLSLREYTEKYAKAFFEDCETLNIEKVEYNPRATEHIEEMIELVKTLINKGFAYEKDGSVYFDISAFNEYGKLSKLDRREIKEGVSVDADEYEKDDVRDFVLWKAKKEGEPSWPSPWGEGRPGWHLECSVMAMKYLGETIDLHAGGEDLIFPHHENEIAQSEAATGKPFSNYWLHCKYLIVEGKKMSKSLGNFFTLRDLIKKGYNPRAIRYVLISSHYRKQLNFTLESVKAAEKAIEKVEGFYQAVSQTKNKADYDERIKELIEKYRKDFEEAMDDDLNVSGALGALFEFIGEVNKLYPDSNIPEANRDKVLQFLEKLNSVFAVFDFSTELPDDEILKLIEERNEARKNRNFKRADEIRDMLKEKGIILEDTKDGTRFKRIK